MRCFITGTGTDVGKTYVCRLLIEGLVAMGRRAGGCKPVCCGDRDDALAIQNASFGNAELDSINPLWFRSAVAPFVAAQLENKEVIESDLLAKVAAAEQLYQDFIVEGAGGWAVPLTDKRTMGDFAAALGYPVVLVVDNRLGALNHSILTAEAIRASGLTLAALVLNHLDIERDMASVTNRSVLEDWLRPPLTIDLLHGETEIEQEILEKILVHCQ